MRAPNAWSFMRSPTPPSSEAFAHSRDIDMNLVNAQQARRVLDRLVGYSISPILWEKVRGRLSAGRVQSVALRLIVEREREIDEFRPSEYWTIAAEFKGEGSKAAFIAKLQRIDDKELELLQARSRWSTRSWWTWRRPPTPSPRSSAANAAANRPPRSSPPPCSRRPRASLGFTAKRTMGLAQGLYEGHRCGRMAARPV